MVFSAEIPKTMSVTPTRIGRSEASANTETSAPEECFSCRLWGGLAHLGIAGYLVSCCNAKQTRLGRISILSFAAGKLILTFFDERLKEQEIEIRPYINGKLFYISGVAGLGIYNLSSIYSPTKSNSKT